MNVKEAWARVKEIARLYCDGRGCSEIGLTHHTHDEHEQAARELALAAHDEACPYCRPGGTPAPSCATRARIAAWGARDEPD